MSSPNLIRLSGFAAVVGGALLIAPDLWMALAGTGSDTYQGTTAEQVSSVLWLVGKLLVVLALPGLYLHQATAARTFGLLAFLLAQSGSALMIGSDWSELFVAPILLQAAPALMSEPPPRLIVGFLLNYGLESLGWLLFGLATFWARVYPRAAAATLIAGVLLPLTGVSWLIIVWNAAILWLGLLLVRETRAAPTAGQITAKTLPQL